MGNNFDWKEVGRNHNWADVCCLWLRLPPSFWFLGYLGDFCELHKTSAKLCEPQENSMKLRKLRRPRTVLRISEKLRNPGKISFFIFSTCTVHMLHMWTWRCLHFLLLFFFSVCQNGYLWPQSSHLWAWNSAILELVYYSKSPPPPPPTSNYIQDLDELNSAVFSIKTPSNII